MGRCGGRVEKWKDERAQIKGCVSLCADKIGTYELAGLPLRPGYRYRIEGLKMRQLGNDEVITITFGDLKYDEDGRIHKSISGITFQGELHGLMAEDFEKPE